MKIAVSGSHGFVGRHIMRYFDNSDNVLTRIVRNKKDKSREGDIVINLEHDSIELEKLEDQDVVIHLGGANIASKRWTKEYKTEILNSRIQSTKIIAEALNWLKSPPKVFICASAIGYYGSHDGATVLDEMSDSGSGFLADVCQQWEETAFLADEHKMRRVVLRIGAVLGKEGGALEKMMTPFKCGLGGRLGDGNQMFSWVAVNEIPEMIAFIIDNDQIDGPVNIVSGDAMSNREFTKVLGGVINRPTIFPMPQFIVRALFGEMGDELLLGGANVKPQKLRDADYRFKYPSLESALKDIV